MCPGPAGRTLDGRVRYGQGAPSGRAALVGSALPEGAGTLESLSNQSCNLTYFNQTEN